MKEKDSFFLYEMTSIWLREMLTAIKNPAWGKQQSNNDTK